MPNVQIIDGADNATFAIFQATEEQFASILPRKGQDLKIIEAVIKRLGQKKTNDLMLTI